MQFKIAPLGRRHQPARLLAVRANLAVDDFPLRLARRLPAEQRLAIEQLNPAFIEQLLRQQLRLRSDRATSPRDDNSGNQHNTISDKHTHHRTSSISSRTSPTNPPGSSIVHRRRHRRSTVDQRRMIDENLQPIVRTQDDA